MHTFTDDIFQQEVLQSGVPTLVDFWAPWCGPCVGLNPVLEQVAKALEGKVAVGKINVDENPNIPTAYGVQTIPTLILFKDKQAIATRAGITDSSTLLTWIHQHLGL